MPFRDIPDSAVRQKMIAAYDLACARLKIDGSDPRSGELAKLIVRLGNGQDAAHLCEQVLEAFKKQTRAKPKMGFSVLRRNIGR
jgi:hypothetical protein